MRRFRVFDRRRRGVTTAEILIGSSILGFMMTGILSLTLSTVTGWQRGSSQSESENAASLALQALARDIADAKRAQVNADGSLTVQMPLVNDQQCFDRSFDGDQVTYYVSSGSLYRKVNSQTGVLFARGVSAVQFAESNGIVTLTLTARITAGRETKETRLVQSVALRNRDRS
jgi:type II secretory pathway pseudopilin PulG